MEMDRAVERHRGCITPVAIMRVGALLNSIHATIAETVSKLSSLVPPVTMCHPWNEEQACKLVRLVEAAGSWAPNGSATRPLS